MRFAQATAVPFGDEIGAEARSSLRKELDRIRRESGSASFDPPLPVRRKAQQTELAAADDPAHLPPPPSVAADPRVSSLTGKILLLGFRGSQPAEGGPKAIRALLQSGLIAGVIFGRDNVHSRPQLKELMKFLWPAGNGAGKPLFAVSEIGGVSDTLPPVRDFERWPSEKDIAAKGDPQYAYSTYRSMGAILSALGFNVNFGPILSPSGNGADLASSFGINPLLAGVLTKTFILGHREENVIAVPIVDGSEHSIRALKTIAVSNPGLPIGSAAGEDKPGPIFAPYEGFLKGAHFCWLSPAQVPAGGRAVAALKKGCEILVLAGEIDKPGSVREEIVLAIAKSLQEGELNLETLSAASEKLSGLRSYDGTRSQ
jgi:Glycosyl hydrolase family 3 N terminal domain